MAPRTLTRSGPLAGWVHPYRSPFICYADGGDEPGPADTAAVVEVQPDEEPADDWTPPSRDEYEQLVAAKKKADGEAAARRKYLRQHGIDPKTGQKTQTDEPDEPEQPAAKDPAQPGPTPAEIRRQIEKAAAEAELKGRRQTRALVTGVNATLAEAGWNGQRLNSLMKLIDLDEVEVDDDGEIVGLSEQIDAIKGEWPEFFKRTRSANPSNGAGGSGQNGVAAVKVEAADKPAPKSEPKDWAEVLAARALRS